MVLTPPNTEKDPVAVRTANSQNPWVVTQLDCHIQYKHIVVDFRILLARKEKREVQRERDDVANVAVHLPQNTSVRYEPAHRIQDHSPC